MDESNRTKKNAKALAVFALIALVVLFCLLLWGQIRIGSGRGEAENANGDSGAGGISVKGYFFPSGKNCTVMVDFAQVRRKLDALDSEIRVGTIAVRMAKEFVAQAEKKCPDATSVRLLAVYIPGTDHYGRPDFGRREKVLRISGSVQNVRNLAEQAGPIDVEELKKVFEVEVY